MQGRARISITRSLAGALVALLIGCSIANATDMVTSTATGTLSLYANSIEAVHIDSSGRVGIGTTSPSNKLHVVTSNVNDGATFSDGTSFILLLPGTVGNGSFNSIVSANDNAIIYSGGSQGTGSFVIAPWAAATSGIRMNSSGYVGISQTSPSYPLDVIGQARFTGGYTTSDRRWKTNITPIKDGLSLVDRLQGVKFDWRRKEFPKMHFAEGRQIGFIAQDVEKVLPEIVSADNQGYKNVSYDSVIPVLAEAVKELNGTVKELDSRVSTLQADNDNLRHKLDRMQAQIRARQ